MDVVIMAKAMSVCVLNGNEVKMEDKQKLIVGQCSFKGAIDLCVAGLIDIDEIDSFTETKTDMIMKLGQGTTYKYPKEVSAPTTYSGGNSNKPSDKQLGFIKRLIKEVPKSMGDEAQEKVSNGMSGKEASALIESLLQAKEDSKPVAKTPTDENEAPF